jgi:hypothetical protein
MWALFLFGEGLTLLGILIHNRPLDYAASFYMNTVLPHVRAPTLDAEKMALSVMAIYTWEHFIDRRMQSLYL